MVKALFKLPPSVLKLPTNVSGHRLKRVEMNYSLKDSAEFFKVSHFCVQNTLKSIINIFFLLLFSVDIFLVLF